jgi:hypothetical protein
MYSKYVKYLILCLILSYFELIAAAAAAAAAAA